MGNHTLALFLHIVGVLGLYAGLALDWATILRLRRAESLVLAREVTSLTAFQTRLVQISGLLVLISGIYMTVTAWGWGTPWILVSLAGLAIIGALSGGVNGGRVRAIRKAAAGASGVAIPPALQRQMSDPVLLTSVQTAGMTGLGVVFLMTVKPDLLGSLITLALALVLGVVSAQPWRRPLRDRARVAEAQTSS
jgi:hypothetical protein